MFLLTMVALLLIGPNVHARDVINYGDDVSDTSSLLERMDRVEKILEMEKSTQENVNGLQARWVEQRDLLQKQSQKLFRLENRFRSQSAQLSYQEGLIRKQNAKMSEQENLIRSQNILLSEQENRLLRQERSIQQLTATVTQVKSLDKTEWSVPRVVVDSVREREVDSTVVPESLSPNDNVTASPPRRVDSVGEREVDSTVVPESLSPNDNVTSSPPRKIMARSDDPGPLEAVVDRMELQISEMNADISTLKNANSQQDLQIQHAQTSTYVHWGSSHCSESSQLVYSGVIGGANHAETGAATNYLCLSMSPVPIDHAIPTGRAFLYGAEYYTGDSHENKDPVCSVCRSSHSNTIMIPGTNVCTPGWQRQYSGFLMSGQYDLEAGNEFICVDSALEARPGTNENKIGKQLTYTFAQCGTSLPCEPYVHNKIVSCVVCSL